MYEVTDVYVEFAKGSEADSNYVGSERPEDNAKRMFDASFDRAAHKHRMPVHTHVSRCSVDRPRQRDRAQVCRS